MPIILSQQDHSELLHQTIKDVPPHSLTDVAGQNIDIVWKYPRQLGQGSIREIQLREGMKLEIANYQLHQDVVIEVPERRHPLEYEFSILQECPQQKTGFGLENYFFSGSGMADRKVCNYWADTQIFNVSFHLESALFCTWMGERLKQSPICIQQLVRATHQARYTQSVPVTLAMQAAIQQILQCPYTGLTQQLYLESKVWELMALHIEQMLCRHSDRDANRIKPDDIERLHHAKEILRNQLSAPPSLNSLARQVGLNEFALKQGFRSVFGTTVFGCLHYYRMERAKELLADGGFNVSEVARQVGFASRGHFAASFRKKFGTNPKAYAQAIQQQSK